MKEGFLKVTLLGLGLVALQGCADLAPYQGSNPYDNNSMILRAAADERGNGERADARQGNSQRTGRSDDRGNGVNLDIDFEEARRLAVANRLTGYESLPPGIRRNLARGKPLPPGIAKRGVPAGMLGELPVLGGHEWQISGTDLVLVELGTQLVVEVLAGVFE